MSKSKEIGLVETDELGMTRQSRMVSIAAWALSAFVIIVGALALILTGKKIFILFIVLGIITPLNVLAYDTFVLKPKVAKLKAEREAAAAAEKTQQSEKEAEQ